MIRFWLSWYWDQDKDGGFSLDSPWWVSGWRDEDCAIVCAAIIAPSEDDAWAIVNGAYDDKTVRVEHRFCDPRSDDWAPFASRFPKADWMVWPTTSKS